MGQLLHQSESVLSFPVPAVTTSYLDDLYMVFNQSNTSLSVGEACHGCCSAQTRNPADITYSVYFKLRSMQGGAAQCVFSTSALLGYGLRLSVLPKNEVELSILFRMAFKADKEDHQQTLLVSGLQDLYHQNILTDCTLLVNGHSLPCHRLVLAACSPYFSMYITVRSFYISTLLVNSHSLLCHCLRLGACSPSFRAMFTTNLSELYQKEIELHSIEAEAMKQILNYLYCDGIHLNDDNVQSVFTAASLFEMLDLCDLCSNYMTQELCVENCVTVYQFASFHNCPALKVASRAFVVNHFKAVLGSVDLLTLSADDLSELLAADNLNVDREERVYDCLLQWVEHDLDQRTKQFPGLFKLVRFSLVSEEFLGEVLSHELVMGNSFCRSVLTMARLCKDHAEVGVMEDLQASCTPRLGMYNRPMMVFIGGSQEAEKRAFTCFDPKTRKNYYAVPLHVSFDFKYRIDHHRAAVTDSGQIFLVGGIFYEDHHFEEAGSALRGVELFDDYRKTWIHCAPLGTPRCAHGLVHLHGLLYATGGKSVYPGGQPLATVECYDPAQDQWRYVAAMPYGLCHHGSVVYDGKIYVIGGMTSQNDVTNVFLEYDPLVDVWSSKPRLMHTPRAEFGVALIQDSLYVIGGCTSEHKLSTMEVYDFKTNCWKYGEDFPEERKSMATVVFDGCIYVCGGVRTVISRMNRTPRVVETKDLWRYDPRDRLPLWTRQVKLVQYANVHACVVTQINTKRVYESEFVSR